MTLPLSVLDLSPVPAGGTAGDALRNTIDLARHAERAGYHRFWVAEHHLNPGVASSSTPVLVALVADATTTIRVGSGAVQLPSTRPVQVAEQFGTVAAVHPGRIDVGLGRFDLHKILRLLRHGPNGRPGRPLPEARVVDGLLLPRPGRIPSDRWLLGELGRRLGLDPEVEAPGYAEQVAEVLAAFDGTATTPDGRPVEITPAQGADAEFVVLGSSPGESARVAGELGLPFAVAYHLVPHLALDAVAAYRAAFRPGRVPAPHVIVSADVVVAETDARARELAAPYGQWVLDIRTGRGAHPYVTPAEARAREWTDAERAGVADRVDTQFVGAPDTVCAGLATLARVTGADELLVTTITTGHEDRVRGHTLLAENWGAG